MVIIRVLELPGENLSGLISYQLELIGRKKCPVLHNMVGRLSFMVTYYVFCTHRRARNLQSIKS